MTNFIIDWPNRGHGYKDEDFNILKKVLLSTNSALSQGPTVAKFENKFNSKFGLNNSKAVASCANALDISIKLSGLNEGDEVLIPSYTYCATALSCLRMKLNIRWVDVNENTFCVSLETIKNKVTKNTRAIIVVHLFGMIIEDIDEIQKFCNQENIVLIEDCAQSLGASHHSGKSSGAFGDFACFSFHSQKNITTLGEGGMLSFKDESLIDRVSSLRLNGHDAFTNKKEYWLPAMTNVVLDESGELPLKSTMTELQAAIGISLLDRVGEMIQRRKYLANMIKDRLKHIDEISFQKVEHSSSHSYHLMPLKITSNKYNRDDFIKYISSKFKIKAIIQYYLLNKYDLFKDYGYNSGETPVAENCFHNILSIPFSPEFSDQNVDYIIESINSTHNYLRE